MPALLTRTPNRPERRFGYCHEFLQRLVVGYVGGHADRLTALFGDLSHGVRAILHVRYDHLGAFSRERHGERRPDPLRGAGHERHFSRKAWHYALRVFAFQTVIQFN